VKWYDVNRLSVENALLTESCADCDTVCFDSLVVDNTINDIYIMFWVKLEVNSVELGTINFRNHVIYDLTD
jgi:hypothetical protein